jgi:hypothetical protein
VSDLWLIVEVPNGAGVMPERYYTNELPPPVRARVEIIAICPSEEKARFVFSHLPQDWRDVTLGWGQDSSEALEIVGLLREESGGLGN